MITEVTLKWIGLVYGGINLWLSGYVACDSLEFARSRKEYAKSLLVTLLFALFGIVIVCVMYPLYIAISFLWLLVINTLHLKFFYAFFFTDKIEKISWQDVSSLNAQKEKTKGSKKLIDRVYRLGVNLLNRKTGYLPRSRATQLKTKIPIWAVEKASNASEEELLRELPAGNYSYAGKLVKGKFDLNVPVLWLEDLGEFPEVTFISLLESNNLYTVNPLVSLEEALQKVNKILPPELYVDECNRTRVQFHQYEFNLISTALHFFIKLP